MSMGPQQGMPVRRAVCSVMPRSRGRGGGRNRAGCSSNVCLTPRDAPRLI
jgi:hypothetical protein